WRRMIESRWHEARFGGVQVQTHDGAHLFEVEVILGGLDPDGVCVELYAEPEDGGVVFRQEMRRSGETAGQSRGFVYSASAPASRPPGDYTPRLIPYMAGVAIPLEAAEILWQR